MGAQAGGQGAVFVPVGVDFVCGVVVGVDVVGVEVVGVDVPGVVVAVVGVEVVGVVGVGVVGTLVVAGGGTTGSGATGAGVVATGTVAAGAGLSSCVSLTKANASIAPAMRMIAPIATVGSCQFGV